MTAPSTAAVASSPGAAAAPADSRCLRCGGSTVERTDPASRCWDCSGSGTATTEADDIYRGEP